jgi:ferredoxin-NADP reductase
MDALIAGKQFPDFVKDPVFLVILACVMCLAIATLRPQPAPARPIVKAKSLCDVSEELRKEELRSSHSYNSLANMDKDERVLSAAEFRPFTVLKITKVTHNTKLIRFEIPHGKPLGLSVGRHITVRARLADGTKVMRAYTPTSRPDQHGYFDLLVKCYEFGKMSSFMHTLRPGNTLEVRGPVGRFRYVPNKYVSPQSMGLVAGGTGLTPCLQVIRCVLEGVADGKANGQEDRTCFTLLFQNRSECDIVLRDELDRLVARFPDRLRVIYFLSNPTTAEFGTAGAKQSVSRRAADKYGEEVRGYINAEAVEALLRPERCPFVCVCGPSGFNAAMKELLVKVGHVDEPAESNRSADTERPQPTIYTW